MTVRRRTPLTKAKEAIRVTGMLVSMLRGLAGLPEKIQAPRKSRGAYKRKNVG